MPLKLTELVRRPSAADAVENCERKSTIGKDCQDAEPEGPFMALFSSQTLCFSCEAPRLKKRRWIRTKGEERKRQRWGESGLNADGLSMCRNLRYGADLRIAEKSIQLTRWQEPRRFKSFHHREHGGSRGNLATCDRYPVDESFTAFSESR